MIENLFWHLLAGVTVAAVIASMGSMRLWLAAIFGGAGAFAIYMFFRHFFQYHVLIPWHLTGHRPIYPLEPLLLGAFGGAFGVALLWSYYQRGLIQVAATFVGGIAGYVAGLATFAYLGTQWPFWLQKLLPSGSYPRTVEIFVSIVPPILAGLAVWGAVIVLVNAVASRLIAHRSGEGR